MRFGHLAPRSIYIRDMRAGDRKRSIQEGLLLIQTTDKDFFGGWHFRDFIIAAILERCYWCARIMGRLLGGRLLQEIILQASHQE